MVNIPVMHHIDKSLTKSHSFIAIIGNVFVYKCEINTYWSPKMYLWRLYPITSIFLLLNKILFTTNLIFALSYVHHFRTVKKKMSVFIEQESASYTWNKGTFYPLGLQITALLDIESCPETSPVIATYHLKGIFWYSTHSKSLPILTDLLMSLTRPNWEGKNFYDIFPTLNNVLSILYKSLLWESDCSKYMYWLWFWILIVNFSHQQWSVSWTLQFYDNLDGLCFNQ